MFEPADATILTVDDNDTSRYITSRILRQAGFNVKEAASGKDALTIVNAQNDQPDLIILDVQLPDIMGFDVCKQIKENPDTASIPILQISAIYTKSEHKVQALEYGADGYIVTPIEASELVATVKSLIRLRKTEEKLQATVKELERSRDELEKRVEERTEELSKARNEAEAARTIAEAANRIKDEFLATVSHELRTPLTAILGWARLLRTGKLEAAAVARAVETIERNAVTQAQLIDDLLDISRIITGKLHLELQPVEIVTVILAAIETILPAATTKNIRIKTRLDSWAGFVSGDPNRLQQIIWNLLANAVKFTPNGGLITIELERLSDCVHINICDNGIGIDPVFLPYVFDRFSQAEGALTPAYGGLGLGLSIVRHLVELHNGSVHAHSDGKGKGATFSVTLPIISAQEAAAELQLTKQVSLNLIKELKFTGTKILIVDDEQDTRDLIRIILEGYEAKTKTASSVAEAFQILQRWRPHILISDIGMPGEDGYSLIRKVREFEAQKDIHIPAIALTAFAKFEDRQKALAAGFQIHLPKPIEPSELITVIAGLLQVNPDGTN